MQIDYQIRFEESWRVASGEGAGPFVDSLVRRDGHDLPFVPGTTVRGLVADALRDLAETLGIDVCDGTVAREKETDPPGELCGITRAGLCPVCAVTGSPHREGQVQWGPARVVLTAGGSAVEEPRKRGALAQEAARTPGLLTRAHPRTSIERRSGRAADEKLFSLEEASPRLRMSGRVDLGTELAAEDVALLVGALRWVREIGGRRRRGLGGCRIEIEAADLAPKFGSWQEAVRHLATLGPESPRPTAAPEPTLPGAPVRSRTPQFASSILQIDGTVVGEVSCGRRPEAGNQIAGLAFLPGSTLRGALAARWGGDRRSEEFFRCFVSGAVRFGFLYPCPGAVTARPTRSSLHTCKIRPGPRKSLRHGLVDLLYEPDAERCEECRSRLIPWDGRPGEELPALALSPHNRIDRKSQTVREGGLFAYEVLPEGTRLRGFIRGDRADDLGRLLAGVNLAAGESFRLRAGRRRGSLGFLDCTVSVPASDSGMGLFPEAAPLPVAWPQRAALRIDLLTPAIVVDRYLRSRRHLLPADFGLRREAFDMLIAETATIAGWNVTHRLPKADDLAVAAGSSFLLEEATESDLEAVRGAALAGVGLRREEGFGAFTVEAVTAADRERR